MDNNNFNPYTGMPQQNANNQSADNQNVNQQNAYNQNANNMNYNQANVDQQTGYKNVGSSGTNQANAYGTYYGSNSGTQQENNNSGHNAGANYNAGSGYTANNRSYNTYGAGNTSNSSGNTAYNTNTTSYSNMNNGSYNAYNANTANNAYGTNNTTSYNATKEAQKAAKNAERERKRTERRAQREQRKREHKGNFGVTLGKVAAIALVFGLVGGGVFTGVSYAGVKALGLTTSTSSSAVADNGSSKNDTTNESVITQTATGNAADLTDVASITSEVMPSIVAITNKAVVTYQSFWGRPSSRELESCGSGIIIGQDDKYLYIVSNNHVVADADSLTVQFNNDTVVDAEIRGTDPADDLAVVQVKLKDIDDDTLSSIKVATLGTADSYQVGSAAIAIGNALGYGQSVTTGVISALNRSVVTTDETTGETVTNDNLIQTDAAINPGNSGGALLNAAGEVIGINSVKYASTEVEGIGYAIPIDYAMPIVEQLIETGEYVDTESAYLGIKGGDVTSEMIAYNYPEGVYVAAIVSGSGADKAGIQEGDVITAIEGTPISGMNELQRELDSYSAGDTVTITLARQQGQGFQEMDVDVTLISASEVE